MLSSRIVQLVDEVCSAPETLDEFDEKHYALYFYIRPGHYIAISCSDS